MKFVRWAAAVALGGLIATGCRKVTTEGTAPDTEPASLTDELITVTRLRAESSSFAYASGYETPARLVIRDAVEWRAAWTRLHERHGSAPPLPAVDFSQEMLILAAMGTRSSGGFSIFVDSAARREQGIDVMIRSVSPGRDCGVTAALTQPVDLARLPAVSGTVSFIERTEVGNCH